ncbi:hypothetical protein [Candidatus Nitrososphaera sp. FF02]|uniref:hypothetical protein n=1 Tax=Candidatus Nitrososphaera sp. FF02 TaxID=3398226 RepID=UPI0039ED9725
MKIGRPIAFVVLAFMIGAIISQGSFAFADDSATNPFRAIWEAIGELQTRTDSLQAQIDDIKTNGVAASEEQPAAKVSETSLAIDIGSGDAGQTVIDIVATNAGPESAVGVKVLTYYQMSLLDVYFIDGAQCTDQARGIIECYVGTIESGGAAQITIDATPLQLGEQAIITSDVSSITEDSDPANNYAEAVFITSEAPVALSPQEQEEEEEPVEEQPASSDGSSEEQQGEQDSEAPAEEQSGEGSEVPAEETEQQGEESSEEQTGQEGSEEQSSGEESSESGEQSSEGGEQSGSESSEGGESAGDSSGDAGSSDSSAGEGSSDSGSDSGDSGSGSSDSGGDSGSEGSSSDGGSSDGGSDGGSDSGGDSGGDSGSSGGESTG